MAIKFIKKKRAEAQPLSPEIPGAKTKIDKNGNVEIVAKNFTMTTRNTEVLTAETWECWGCGHTNTGDICLVCGKERIR